jgi:predicted CXXCH cytochrome family protein
VSPPHNEAHDSPSKVRNGRPPQRGVRCYDVLVKIGSVVSVPISIATLAAIAGAIGAAADPEYADPRSCAACHSKIAENYAPTAMARSFARPSNVGAVKDYYHVPSETHFAMFDRNGRTYQRRWQAGPDGKETNIEEKQIDFVMGSGSHVRTFLHRTASGELQQLPLAWYASRGGYWAMNPGYDQPNQPDSLRKISYECMFCHNAYPEIPADHEELGAEPVFSRALPEGIDCQRCHGPGRRHVEAARTPGSAVEAIRAAIANPARLAPDRQMEVCAQCHLETTSFPFPHSILKYDRAPFSYRPGEPLSDFSLFFDHAPAAQARASDPVKEDRFQIVSSVYRLKMSACFLKSDGAMKCTTCHDPHRGDSPSDNRTTTAGRYAVICLRCHAALASRVKAGQHTASNDCIACHMPKRRTGDVVHAVMTDHYIQRRKPDRDLLAEIPEPHGPSLIYHGDVMPYDGIPFPRTPENELYLALAQVREGNNTPGGLEQFAAAIRKYQPKQAEFYVELADALVKSGDPARAIPLYKEAIARKPASIAAAIGLGNAYEKSDDLASAAQAFHQAAALSLAGATAWMRLGEAEIKSSRPAEAEAALRKSLELDPEVPEAHYALASLFAQEPARAEASYREAIRLQPDYSAARMNLAIVLSRENLPAEAESQFQAAVRYHPDYALGHYNYGLMLIAQHRQQEAAMQMKLAVDGAASLDPRTREEARRLLSELDRQK